MFLRLVLGLIIKLALFFISFLDGGNIFGDNFIEIFLDCSFDECKKRDIFPSELIRYYDIQHDSPHKLAETLYPLIQESFIV